MIPGFLLCNRAVILAVAKIMLDFTPQPNGQEQMYFLLNRHINLQIWTLPSHDHPMIPNTLSGRVPFCVMLHKLPDSNPNSLMGGENWRIPSPAPVMLSSPLLHVMRPIGPMPRAWDLIDVIQLSKETYALKD